MSQRGSSRKGEKKVSSSSYKIPREKDQLLKNIPEEFFMSSFHPGAAAGDHYYEEEEEKPAGLSENHVQFFQLALEAKEKELKQAIQVNDELKDELHNEWRKLKFSEDALVKVKQDFKGKEKLFDQKLLDFERRLGHDLLNLKSQFIHEEKKLKDGFQLQLEKLEDDLRGEVKEKARLLKELQKLQIDKINQKQILDREILRLKGELQEKTKAGMELEELQQNFKVQISRVMEKNRSLRDRHLDLKDEISRLRKVHKEDKKFVEKCSILESEVSLLKGIIQAKEQMQEFVEKNIQLCSKNRQINCQEVGTQCQFDPGLSDLTLASESEKISRDNWTDAPSPIVTYSVATSTKKVKVQSRATETEVETKSETKEVGTQVSISKSPNKKTRKLETRTETFDLDLPTNAKTLEEVIPNPQESRSEKAKAPSFLQTLSRATSHNDLNEEEVCKLPWLHERSSSSRVIPQRSEVDFFEPPLRYPPKPQNETFGIHSNFLPQIPMSPNRSKASFGKESTIVPGMSRPSRSQNEDLNSRREWKSIAKTCNSVNFPLNRTSSNANSSFSRPMTSPQAQAQRLQPRPPVNLAEERMNRYLI